jgi:hypothetical protein
MRPLYLLLQQDDITRNGARDEARRELRKAVYHVRDESPVRRVMDWALERLDRLLDRIVRLVPGGTPSLLIVILLVVALAIAIRLGLGPTRLRDALTDRRRGARPRTAAEYRAEAEALAARGEFKEAVRARFRAIIRELEERGVLDPRAGRTAGEIAREGGAAVPFVRSHLDDAATTFDLAWYGHRGAGAAEYERVRAADDAIRAARLVTVS